MFIQNICAFIVFAIWSHQKKHLGVNEKTSVSRGNIAPGILTVLVVFFVMAYLIKFIFKSNQDKANPFLREIFY